LAREKAGQYWREGRLSKRHKRSTKAKRRRRDVISADLAKDVKNRVQSSQIVSSRLNDLQTKIHGDRGHQSTLQQIHGMQTLNNQPVKVQCVSTWMKVLNTHVDNKLHWMLSSLLTYLHRSSQYIRT
jgi:hypothetical protein